MKSASLPLFFFGLFLLVAGLSGYLSNPEKAKTALASGGLFGSLSLALGWLNRREWRPAFPAAIGMSLLLAAVFAWRSFAGWSAFAGGDDSKQFAALLITSMLVATVSLAAWLFILRGRESESAPPHQRIGSTAPPTSS